MGHKSESCSQENTAARNARALQKAQEGPKTPGGRYLAELIASAIAWCSAEGNNALAMVFALSI